MKKTLLYSIALLVLLFAAVGCEVLDPEEPIPSYIAVDEINLNADQATQGTSSQKISSCWVYVNDQPMGVFELPALVPVLETGEAKVRIDPGIFSNGIAAVRMVYPYYSIYVNENIELVEGEVKTINPTINYRDNMVFALNTTFEVSNNFEPKEGSAGFIVENDSEHTFETNYARVSLNAGVSSFKIGSIDMFDLPLVFETPHADFNVPFIELNYKNTQAFDVYARGSTAAGTAESTILTINPKEEWNKIYINLNDFVNGLGADTYEFGFKASLNSGIESADFYFDNIKLVYFEKN